MYDYDITSELLHEDCFTKAEDVFSVYGVTRSIRAIVWHSMEGFLQGALAEWKNKGQASAHLCVTRNGDIYKTVDFEHVAWHAGTDNSTGRTPFWKAHNINPYSIGVELEGFAGQPFTQEQVNSIGRISRYFNRTIRPEHTFDMIDGHHAHSEISNQRSDPGPTFDWNWILPGNQDNQEALDDIWNVRQALNKDGASQEGVAPYLRKLSAELMILKHDNYGHALNSLANQLDEHGDTLFNAIRELKGET